MCFCPGTTPTALWSKTPSGCKWRRENLLNRSRHILLCLTSSVVLVLLYRGQLSCWRVIPALSEQVDVSKANNVLDRWINASARLLVNFVRWAQQFVDESVHV